MIMDLKLYSTGCPKCKVLKAKLDQKNLDYEVISDEDLMIEKGMMSVPQLEVDGKMLLFKEAIDWINGYQEASSDEQDYECSSCTIDTSSK